MGISQEEQEVKDDEFHADSLVRELLNEDDTVSEVCSDKDQSDDESGVCNDNPIVLID